MSGMRIPKEIRELPWPEAETKNININFFVTAHEAKIKGERWLAVSFLPNPEKYKNVILVNFHKDGFRVVCRKGADGNDANVIWRTGRVNVHGLREAMSPFSTYPECCYPWISEEDERTIARFLEAGSRSKRSNHGIDELCYWVGNAREDAKRRRRAAAGELDDGDYVLCPTELPPGLEGYIRRVMLREDRILLYKRGNVRGTCCLCGAHVTAGEAGKRFRQGEIATCPACGEKLACVLEGGAGFDASYVGNIATVQRGTDGKTVFIRFWHLTRDNSAKWRDIPMHLSEIMRWGIRGSKVAKWEHEHKYNYCMSTWREQLKDWTRVTGTVTAFPDYSYYFYLPEDWRDIFAETGLRYCEAGQYESSPGRKDMIRFLLDWARYPAIELFWKAGYRQIVADRVTGKETRGAANWRRRSIRDALEFPARYLKLMPPGDWDANKLSRMAELWRLILGMEVPPGKVRFSERDLLALVKSDITLRWLYPALGKAPAEKIVDYAKKQGCGLYRDYLTECWELRLDLKNRQVLFPKNFPEAHARTAELLAIRKNKVDKEKFAKQSAALERYRYNENGILIRPAATLAELIREGTALQHCVARYAERMAKGETAIFLVRREAEPDKPWYTLELCHGKVVQCRTIYNASYLNCPEVLDFVERWMSFTKKVDRKGKKAGVPAA